MTVFIVPLKILLFLNLLLLAIGVSVLPRIKLPLMSSFITLEHPFDNPRLSGPTLLKLKSSTLPIILRPYLHVGVNPGPGSLHACTKVPRSILSALVK